MRHALAGALCATASLFALLTPQVAEAAWPKTIDVEICWNFVCDGTFTQWTLRRSGEFVDPYGAGGEFYFSGFYPAWPYTASWVVSPVDVGLLPSIGPGGPNDVDFDGIPDSNFLLFYDNGLTTYTGRIQGTQIRGTMVTTSFYPPYEIYGQFCKDGCP